MTISCFGRKIQAITIDFWNTIAQDINYGSRTAARQNAAWHWLNEHGYHAEESETRALVNEFMDEWLNQWIHHQNTLTSSHLAEFLNDRLRLEMPPSQKRTLAEVIEDVIRVHQPVPFPEAASVIRQLSSHVPLALISDTGVTGPRSINWLLEQWSIDTCFQVKVFSSEIGTTKPDTRMFQTALNALNAEASHSLHIGDLEMTDVLGARKSGMLSIRFKVSPEPISNPEQSDADRVVDSWSDIRELLFNC